MAHGHDGNQPAKLRWSDLAVFASQWMCETSGWEGPSIVAHPPVIAQDYRATPGERVTLINCSAAKGVDLFWQLAASMSDVDFLAVEGFYGRQQLLTRRNVELQSRTHDMRSVYGRTRVLLAPSAYEGWARVGVEAACSGIPTIAHPCEGLLEPLGDAAIFVDRSDQAGWEAEIRRLADPDEWAAASASARDLADRLDPVAELDRFAAALEEVPHGAQLPG